MSKIRLQDIAEQAGVSASTVSRVFSQDPRITQKVRECVLKIAERYDYHPRLPAKNRNIVILIPDAQEYPAHYCVEMLVIALSGALAHRNFRTEILPWNNRERLKDMQFYGAAAIGIDVPALIDWPRHFNQPLVVLDRNLPESIRGIWQVSSDEFQCMKLAVTHFRKNRLKRIGVIVYGEPDSGNSPLRMTAAKNALAESGYPTDDCLTAFANQDNAIQTVAQMLKKNVDALLCPGHSGGLLTAHALHVLNKKIPEDISLISSEICFFSPYGIPPQTTFCPDYQRLAATAVEAFNAVLWGRPFPQRTYIPCHLIERNSVRGDA